jgi:ribosomal protein L5
MQVLKNHYEKVVKEELIERYGHEHTSQVGKLSRVTVGWSLRNRQFNVKHVPAA